MIRPLLCLTLAALSVLPAHAESPNLEGLKKDVIKLHAVAKSGICDDELIDIDDEAQLTSWHVRYRPVEDSTTDTGELFLYRVLCSTSDTHRLHHYYWYRDIYGLQPLALAVPTFDADYETSWDITTPLVDLKWTGMRSETLMFNSEFDPESNTITDTSNASGREATGLSGTWSLLRSDFSLVHYDIDVTEDRKVNPIRLVDFSAEDWALPL